MDFIKSEFFLYLLAWFSSMAGVWLLFDRAAIVLNDNLRTKLSAWLKNDNIRSSKEWPDIFIAIFDNFFGEKHFSWKCFFRSSLASICVVIMMTLVLYLVFGSFPLVMDEPASYLFFFGITFLLNIIPDYFSLLQTRKILNWMRNSNLFVRFLLLVLDFLLTTFIVGFALGLGLILTFTIFLEPNFNYFFEALKSLISDFPYFKSIVFSLFSGEDFMFSVWIYSTFVTSAWIWFFVASSFVVKFFGLFRKGLGSLKKVFNVDEKPLRTLGFVSMLLVTIIFVIAPFL